MVIDGIKVLADSQLSREEILQYVGEEKKLWEKSNKRIGLLEISLDGEEVIVKATEKSPIRRVRRITGYLSCIDNFNDAKVAECSDRTQHCKH